MLLYTLIAFAVFVLATILTETESWTLATGTMIGSVVAIQYLGVADVFAFVQTHLLETSLYTLGYIVAGVAWSFIKWFSFLYRFRDTFREEKERFRKVYDDRMKSGRYDLSRTWENGEETSEPAQFHYKKELKEYLSRFTDPTAADNKGRIVGWMAFGPFSLVGTFLNDPVRRLFNALYRRFKILYQKMADHVFRNDPELR